MVHQHFDCIDFWVINRFVANEPTGLSCKIWYIYIYIYIQWALDLQTQFVPVGWS
jgi:hypothetical protein